MLNGEDFFSNFMTFFRSVSVELLFFGAFKFLFFTVFFGLPSLEVLGDLRVGVRDLNCLLTVF